MAAAFDGRCGICRSITAAGAHLNAGQRAILVALAYPKQQQGKRATSLEIKEVNSATLSQARCINQWTPEEVEEILNGGGVFAQAFDLANAKRKRADEIKAHMDRLEKEAPDLHALVREERGMSAAEGIAARGVLSARAIALAILFPEPERGGKRRRGSISESKIELDQACISAARLSHRLPSLPMSASPS